MDDGYFSLHVAADQRGGRLRHSHGGTGFRTSTDRSDRGGALLPAVCADFTALSIQDRAIVRGQRYRRSQIKFAISAAQRTISPYIRIFPLRRSNITI